MSEEVKSDGLLHETAQGNLLRHLMKEVDLRSFQEEYRTCHMVYQY